MDGAPARSVDGVRCARIACERQIDAMDAAVVAAVDARVLGRAATAARSALAGDWSRAGGRCAFHRGCWEALAAGNGTRLDKRLCHAAAETLETHDALPDIEAAARQAAAMVAAAEGRAVVFTGAGLSVAAGIPDYRGTAGVDTRADLGQEDQDAEDTPYTALEPTVGHRVLAAWDRRGVVSYTATQNCDGLHDRAGTKRSRLTELHGSVFVEACEACGREYRRIYEVDAFSTDCSSEPWFEECNACGWGHYTGRRCSRKGCRGRLKDTIVNFGDPLHDTACGGLPAAEAAFSHAEVCLAIGSSLLVSPAAELPLRAGAVVVVGLQDTPLDERAAVRARCEADVFLALTDRCLPEARGRAHKAKRPRAD